MRLVHWSKDPIAAVQDTSQGDPGMKPKGLWVSDEESEQSWSAWCEYNEMGWLHGNVYEVALSSAANILVIATGVELEDFNREYRADHAYMGYGWSIDWLGVAYDHQGIMITPYQWELRFSERLRWYYGWDCASGCIWDADAVADLRELVT